MILNDVDLTSAIQVHVLFKIFYLTFYYMCMLKSTIWGVISFSLLIYSTATNYPNRVFFFCL